MRASSQWVLGLNHGAHDAAAALLRDGEIVSLVEQERLSRRKRADNESPASAALWCLQSSSISLADVAQVALGSDHDALAKWLGLTEEERTQQLPFDSAAWLYPEQVFGGVKPKRQVSYPHHLAHAASAFWPSGFDRAAILVVDAMGEDCATTIAVGETNGIRILETFPIADSLGYFYEAATRYAGFKSSEAGKLMGLAPYGKPLHRLPLAFEDGPIWRDVARIPGSGRAMIRARRDLLMRHFADHCYPFVSRSPKDTALAFANFAASAQSALEECIVSLATRAMTLAGCDRLVLAGGVALNCSANGALWRRASANDLYVQPMANDAGVALGAALLSFDAEVLSDKRATMSHAYWGPKAEEAEIRAALSVQGISVTRLPRLELYTATARILANGGLVAWHQGRCEVGPRSLGARSLLADPRKRDSLIRVNTAKQREMWRPLAPAVIEECFSTYFVGKPNPFMIIAAEVREDARRIVPAVVHIDGSARPQAVSATHSPDFHALLRAFGEISGVPMLVNTSLNVAEEPIACSPSDSMRAFEACSADALVIEDFLVTRSAPH